MKLTTSGLHPFARVRPSITQSRSKPQLLRNRAPCIAGPRTRARQTGGLSAAGVKLFRLLAYRTEPGRPRGPLLAWPGWEHVAQRLWPTIGIPNAPYGLLRMRIKQHRGEPLTLPSGARIEKNAVIGELHCDNQALLHLVLKRRVNPYRACREDLRWLAKWVREDSLGMRVEAFFGRTMLAVGAARMGFAVRDVRKSAWLWLERFFMIGLLLLYTEGGVERLKRGTTVLSFPREVWISRGRLINLYGDRDGRPVARESSSGAENGVAQPAAAAIDLGPLPGEGSASTHAV